MADDTMVAAEPADTASGFDNVDLIDASLTGKLCIVRVGSDRSDENLLSILAALKNLTGRTLRLEAQTVYRDADGSWINGGRAGWIALDLKPHGELNYRSEALSGRGKRLSRPHPNCRTGPRRELTITSSGKDRLKRAKQRDSVACTLNAKIGCDG